MPWKPSDAKEHSKKANTPAKQKQWSDTANGVLKKCLADGGDQKTCEASAIRVANSKMTEAGIQMSQKIPKGALVIQESPGEERPMLQFAESGDGTGKKKLDMVIYSGGIIKNHFWWNNLGLDLSGIKLGKPKYPILESHDTGRKIGWMGKPMVDKDLRVDPDKVTFLETEAATEFQKNAESGFPYESSLYGVPLRVERIAEGASADVNGHKLKGPGTIWREWVFKEASVCVFGYDSNTVAKVFAEDIEVDFEEAVVGDDHSHSLNNKEKEEVKTMNMEELRAQHPELVKAIEDAATVTVTAQFDKEKADMAGKLSAKDKEVDDLRKAVSELQKTDAIRAERENKGEATRIFTELLSESDIPEYLHDKVRASVSHTGFVKEGILDQTTFSAAVKSEIEDWTKRLTNASVLGGVNGQHRSLDPDKKKAEELAKADDAAVDKMLQLSGDVKATDKKDK